ncbi:hypothetical protein CMI42_03535 [Candidatus Pacearchaeota archaeon]|nr:hypothetical protein [Candidatus Pacearchaeota archaeon]|tara:strand:+ start:1131 stop:1388 length:258 start_codon:yes stop_codon:yes gene_type:complete
MEKEKAQLMFKLAFSKKNWGAKYDRLEHFKRFQNLNKIVKELNKKEWLLIKNKPNYIGISLNTKYKKEIIGFIEGQMPHVSGSLK